jgi:hypothetical protein
MRILLILSMGLSLSLSLASFELLAQEDDDASTPGPEKCPKIQASTIFVKDKAGNRQDGSAERISETHDTAEAQGWDYNDLQVYIEDGDLQGFFITYTREHPCNKE